MTHAAKSRHRVMEYAEAHPEEVSYLSAKQLGERCGVSDSTVIRAVQSIGHRGYPQYQKWLRKNLERRRTTVERFSATNKEDPLANGFVRDIANLQTTWETISREAFDQAVDMLSQARRVWILGLRMAHATAVIMKEGLSFLGTDVFLLAAGNGDLWDEVSAVKQGDVFVCIGLPRYTQISVELADYAQRKGARMIAITDGATSPLAAMADVWLGVFYKLDGYIESFTSAVSLSQALLVAVSRAKGSQGLAALREKEKLWEAKQVYWRAPRKKSLHG